ncbi:MAG: hypothetical protein L6Q71_10580, partial [Planctomycetes bacterium]|nr:hypothetical protein [Planctomycetota bacterium]
EAGLIFAESGDTRSPSYRQLLETAAIADFTRGNLVRGRERMLHVAPLVDDIRRRGFTMPILAIMHFYAGAMTYREVFTHFDDQDTPFLLSPLVFWSEKPDDLDHYERALERCVNPASIRNMLLVSVTSLLAAQRGSGAMKQFDDRFPRPSDHDTHATFRAMNYPVIRCQIALAAGQHAQAVKAVIETEVMLEKAKPRVELPIGFAAIHHRNVLRASADSKDKYLATARIRALDFFKRHIDAGYAVFRSALM